MPEDIVADVEPQEETTTAGQPEAQVKEAVDWEKKYKELQSATQRKIEKLQREPNRSTPESDARLSRLEEMNALILDKITEKEKEEEETYYETPKKRTGKSFYEETVERRRKDEAEQQYKQYAQKVKDDMDEIITESNLDWSHPELKKVLEIPNIQDAQTTFNRAVSKILRENVEKDKKAIADQVREELKRELIKTGALKVSTGPSAGSSVGRFTRDDVINYDPRGKTVREMQKDADALLDQITKK